MAGLYAAMIKFSLEAGGICGLVFAAFIVFKAGGAPGGGVGRLKHAALCAVDFVLCLFAAAALLTDVMLIWFILMIEQFLQRPFAFSQIIVCYGLSFAFLWKCGMLVYWTLARHYPGKAVALFVSLALGLSGILGVVLSFFPVIPYLLGVNIDIGISYLPIALILPVLVFGVICYWANVTAGKDR